MPGLVFYGGVSVMGDSIESLREALRHSPDNVPLRRHLAETLLSRGASDEAETEYRKALALAPHSVELKLGLARSFYGQGKDMESLVVVEDLLKQSDAPTAAQMLHCRLLLRQGDVQRAVTAYHMAVDEDPDAADADTLFRPTVRNPG